MPRSVVWGVEVPSNFGRKEWFLFPLMWLPKTERIRKNDVWYFIVAYGSFTPIWNQFWSPSHFLAENNDKTINHEAIKWYKMPIYLPLVEGLHHSLRSSPMLIQFLGISLLAPPPKGAYRRRRRRRRCRRGHSGRRCGRRCGWCDPNRCGRCTQNTWRGWSLGGPRSPSVGLV